MLLKELCSVAVYVKDHRGYDYIFLKVAHTTAGLRHQTWTLCRNRVSSRLTIIRPDFVSRTPPRRPRHMAHGSPSSWSSALSGQPIPIFSDRRYWWYGRKLHSILIRVYLRHRAQKDNLISPIRYRNKYYYSSLGFVARRNVRYCLLTKGWPEEWNERKLEEVLKRFTHRTEMFRNNVWGPGWNRKLICFLLVKNRMLPEIRFYRVINLT